MADLLSSYSLKLIGNNKFAHTIKKAEKILFPIEINLKP